jgi:hypothetical protein
MYKNGMASRRSVKLYLNYEYSGQKGRVLTEQEEYPLGNGKDSRDCKMQLLEGYRTAAGVVSILSVKEHIFMLPLMAACGCDFYFLIIHSFYGEEPYEAHVPFKYQR